MATDLLVYILLGFVQVCTAVWGGIVSARSLPGTERSAHIVIFVVLGLVGTALIVWSGVRAYDSQAASALAQTTLQKQLNETTIKLNQSLSDGAFIKGQLSGFGTVMAQLGKQTSDPTLGHMADAIVKMASTKSGVISHAQLYVDKIISAIGFAPQNGGDTFNYLADFLNNGSDVAHSCLAFSRISIGEVAKSAEDRLWSEFIENISAASNGAGRDLGVGQGTAANGSPSPEPLKLSAEQFADIQTGKRVIYLMSYAKYRDAYDQHSTESCVYFFGKDNISQQTVHYCSGHNIIR